jgi:pyruvate kinase
VTLEHDRRTKIVATIGPECSEPKALRNLLAAGVDVVRLNLSHGPVEEHLARVFAIRKAAADIGRVVAVVAVLADLPGPKVRAGSFGRESAQLVPQPLAARRACSAASAHHTGPEPRSLAGR